MAKKKEPTDDFIGESPIKSSSIKGRRSSVQFPGIGELSAEKSYLSSPTPKQLPPKIEKSFVQQLSEDKGIVGRPLEEHLKTKRYVYNGTHR